MQLRPQRRSPQMVYNEIQNIIQRKRTLQGRNKEFFNRRKVSWKKGT